MSYTVDSIQVYSKGIVACSVCVPKDMGTNMIEKLVNMENPTGIESNWELSEDKTFKSGHSHPCECIDDKNRLHYLLHC